MFWRVMRWRCDSLPSLRVIVRLVESVEVKVGWGGLPEVPDADRCLYVALVLWRCSPVGTSVLPGVCAFAGSSARFGFSAVW